MTPADVREARRSPWRTHGWRLSKQSRRALVGAPTAFLRTLPDVLVVGAQRSGTTSLYQYLRRHPDVRWPRLVKGVHWFDVRYDHSETWYRSHFPLRREMAADHGRTTITGEACPYYLFHPAVPERVAAHLPDVKVVVLLRDPVGRAWSHYQHERARGFEHLSFGEALDAEDERLRGADRRLHDAAGRSFEHRHFSYVARGMYAQQLQRWYDHVPRQNVLVMESADLRSRTQDTYDRLCDFLGLAHHELTGTHLHNAGRYEAMDPSVAARLRAVFEGPDAALRDLLGHPLSWTT